MLATGADEPKAGRSSGVSPERAPARERRLVLLVDDCEDTRNLYAEYLDLSGFDVKEAGDGLDAIAQASAMLPDVVVMDLSLPGVDGRTAVERLKADPRTRAIPVIVVSGYSADVVDNGHAPWNAYVGKPCVPEDLLAAIGRVLEPAR
jgi:two-component system, cell cycle response regulator DivK